jgi:hypothetical protein
MANSTFRPRHVELDAGNHRCKKDSASPVLSPRNPPWHNVAIAREETVYYVDGIASDLPVLPCYATKAAE